MSRQIRVQVIKTYYKSTSVLVDIPEDLTDNEVDEYLKELEEEDCIFSDALADASLEGDTEGVEIDNWEDKNELWKN